MGMQCGLRLVAAELRPTEHLARLYHKSKRNALLSQPSIILVLISIVARSDNVSDQETIH